MFGFAYFLWKDFRFLLVLFNSFGNINNIYICELLTNLCLFLIGIFFHMNFLLVNIWALTRQKNVVGLICERINWLERRRSMLTCVAHRQLGPLLNGLLEKGLGNKRWRIVIEWGYPQQILLIIIASHHYRCKARQLLDS